MGMGGMDMSGFRMIPSGMGLMVPAHTPWPAIEFALFARSALLVPTAQRPKELEGPCCGEFRHVDYCATAIFALN